MMKINTTMFLLLLSSFAAFAGQLHKCTINGNVTYQDVPCAGGGGQVVQKTSPYDPDAAQQSRASLAREISIRQEIKRQPSRDRLDTAKKNLIDAQKHAMDVTGASSPAEAMQRIKSEKCVNLLQLKRLAEADFRSTQSASSRASMNAARTEFMVNGCTQ